MDGIDAARAVAAFGVVCIHTEALGLIRLPAGPFVNVGEIVNQTARLAVPFFLIASGFFLGRGLAKQPPVVVGSRYLKRVGLLYLLWLLIYSTLPLPATVHEAGWIHGAYSTFVANTAAVRAHPFARLRNGPEIHLWFFPALLFAIVFIVAWVQLGLRKFILPLGLLLYAVGMFNDTYASSVFHLHVVDNNITRTFLIAPGLLAIGVALTELRQRSLKTGATILLAGLFCHLAEAAILKESFGRPIDDTAFAVGTLLGGIGLMIIATAIPSQRVPGWLSNLGILSLGIYVSHVYIWRWTMEARPWIGSSLLWTVLIAPLVFTLAAVFTLLCQQVPGLRRLVS